MLMTKLHFTGSILFCAMIASVYGSYEDHKEEILKDLENYNLDNYVYEAKITVPDFVQFESKPKTVGDKEIRDEILKKAIELRNMKNGGSRRKRDTDEPLIDYDATLNLYKNAYNFLDQYSMEIEYE